MINSIQKVPFGVIVLATLLFACERHDNAASSVVPDDAASALRLDVPRVSVADEEDGLRRAARRAQLEEFQLSHAAFANEECCSDPGEVSGCWWEDADDDGITCSPDRPCPGGQSCNYDLTGPVGQGLCECAGNSDCNNGIDKQGVCNTDLNVCGPSFCNGYLVCSCWGGCKSGTISGYNTPEDMCEDRANGYAGFCCEGAYPRLSDGKGLGFCSNTESCVLSDNDCSVDADCVDEYPCTANRCENGLCTFVPIDNAVPEGVCGTLEGGQSTDCVSEWCIGGSCSSRLMNADGDCEDNPQNVDIAWYGASGRDDDDDESSCYFLRCDDDGRCQAREDLAEGLVCDEDDGTTCTDAYCAAGLCHQDATDHEGERCNEDDDACTLDVCDASGVCVTGPAKDCDDDNWCTFPDECQDLDSDHLVWSCSNPAIDGNAENYGYPDTSDCEDLLCVGGFEDPTAKDCSAYNPFDYDMQCNSYACVDGNGEDNCTLSYVPSMNMECTDGDACTLDDTCQDGGGFGYCESGATKNCNDSNICTVDTCVAGVCVNTLNEGFECDADGDPCTVGDACDGAGTCAPGPLMDCLHLSTNCANGVCVAGECEAVLLPAGTLCDADNDMCTEDDLCDGSGNCEADPIRIDCSSFDDDCNTGYCESFSGMCRRDPTDHEGDSCDADGSFCTPDDTCQSGACVADTPVDCSGDDDQCNNHSCDPFTGGCVFDNALLVGIACNDDDDGCTSDTCQGSVVGDEALSCTPGPIENCDDGNPCTTDSCQSLGWNAFQCNNPDAPDTTLCEFDSNGCTEGDHCDGAGACVAGPDVVCPATDDCHIATCNNTGEDSYTCTETVVADCCLADAECLGLGFACEAEPAPPVGCTQVACIDSACGCDDEPLDASCTDYDIIAFPENGYEGLCDGNGLCEPSALDPPVNNLCSDLFDSADPTSLDPANAGYMGAIPSDGTNLSVTGTTLTAANNYRSAADQCQESTGGALGASSPDALYVVEYDTNDASDYQLYSFVVKVEADYDVAVYVSTTIDQALECPEGNAPTMDTNTETFEGVLSENCAYPYTDSPSPPAIEEDCDVSGNTTHNQECCDPCTDTDCFTGCKLGYNDDGTTCDMCQGAGGPGYDPWAYTGSCDALWIYPDDPFDCGPEVPGPEYAGFDTVAVTVVSQTGITDGSPGKLFIVVDGVGGDSGNFYLTVERQAQEGGPCARANDDTRVFDLTDVDSGGETFLGTLAGAINSEPAGGGDCGGHDCASVPAESGCHEGGFGANAFWPNNVFFQIHRDTAEGDGTYCIRTDESIADGADLTLVVSQRDDNTATSICNEPYTELSCRNDIVGNNIQWEFSATAGELYLFSLSQHDGINRPCDDASDSCRYALTVSQGGCPFTCYNLDNWYGGGIAGTYTVNGEGSGFSPSNTITGSTAGASNDYDEVGGWDAGDRVYQLNVSEDASVGFSGCTGGGTGGFNGQIAVVDCQGNVLTWNNDGCDLDGMPEFQVDLSAAGQPYYLVVDGFAAGDEGAFDLVMWYPGMCNNTVQDGDETDTDCGGDFCDACADGSSCDDAADCVSGVCDSGMCIPAGECTEAGSIDLGDPNVYTDDVSSNACVKVVNYAGGWTSQYIALDNQKINKSTEYPIPYTWRNGCTGASGSGNIEVSKVPVQIGPIDPGCATVIDLNGGVGETVNLRYDEGP